MLLSVVVPCYNEIDALPLFLPELYAVTDKLPEIALEVLLVDDGSRDGTLPLLRRLAAEDPRVRLLSFSRNFGKEAALHAGLCQTTGDVVAVMDADLQDPPELLLSMLPMLLDTDCDCVACRRANRTGEPPVRSLFSRMFYRLINRVSPVRLEDGVRDFRLMRREMVDAVLRLPEKRRFSKGIFAWVGFSVCYIPYENVERVAGVTKWSFWGLLHYALEGIFTLTPAPLSISFIFAACAAVLSAVLLLCGASAAALRSLAACLALGGIGLLGMYTARIHDEVKRRPLYIEKKR